MRILFLVALLFFGITGNVGAYDYTQDANCVGAWLMEVDEDPLTDSSTYGNDADLKGAGEPNYDTASPPASYSTGYYTWDASNDYANVGDPAELDLTTKASFVSWWMADTLPTGGGSSKWFLGKDQNGGRSYDFGIRRNDGNNHTQLSVQINGSALNETGAGQTDLTGLTGTWYHAGFSVETGDVDTRIYYHNGVAEASGVWATDIASTGTNLHLGARTYGGFQEYWLGDLDEIAIFNDVLTSTEINAIMDNGLGSRVGRIWITGM